MDNNKKPSASEEFLDSYFDAFKTAFGGDLRPFSKSQKCKGESNVEIVPDSYEEEDRKLELGEEVNSRHQPIVTTDKYHCPDLNIPYHDMKSEVGSSSVNLGSVSNTQGDCIMKNLYSLKYKRKTR